uniref:Transducer of ERBB2, 2 n=1 Tax=Takifugu rubripes TaxID=31033 RepID=A0A674N6E6_TAKRU
MHLEVKVALNFIVSYLYNKLPRRRADLFGEELEKILVSRFVGHWYPEAPLRGSAFRCIHLGAQRDPVVELAAKRSGLDTEEVRANVPAELSVWIDPFEVSYQIGEKGAVKVLYLEDPPVMGSEEAKGLCFNPDAQVFVPIGNQVAPALMPSLSSSPTPLSRIPFLPSPQQPPALPTARPQPITFTTATFAATKFGSTKMKKCSGAVSAASTATVLPPTQRMLSRSPTTISAPEPLKHKPLSLSLHSLGGPIASQLSPNAKEFVYPGSPGSLFFDDAQPIHHQSSPFQPPLNVGTHSTFDPFSSPPPAQNVGIIGNNGGIAYMEKSPFVEGLGSYNLQYPSQSFQPVVLAN